MLSSKALHAPTSSRCCGKTLIKPIPTLIQILGAGSAKAPPSCFIAADVAYTAQPQANRVRGILPCPSTATRREKTSFPLLQQETQKQLPMSLLSKPLGTYSQPPASCSRFYVGNSAPESPVLQGTFTASETDVHGAWGAAVLATASHPRRVGCVFLSQKKKDPL